MESALVMSRQLLRGLVDSWRWVLVVHRINEEPVRSSAVVEEKERKAPLTALELRRRQAKAREAAERPEGGPSKESSSPAPEAPRAKKKPSTQLLLCVLSNVGVALCLWFCHYLVQLSGLWGSKSHGFRAGLYWLLSHAIHATWVVPYFAVTRVVNVLWFQDIAKASLRQLDSPPPASKASFSLGVADFVLAVVLETVFLVQGRVLGLLVPMGWVGWLVELVHSALLHSLYAFEYGWCSAGDGLRVRLERLEAHWPYFLGFGLSLALPAAAADSLILSGCLFGAGFPLLLISSFHARPPDAVPEAMKGLRLPVFQPSLRVTTALSVKLMTFVTQRQEGAMRRPSINRQPQGQY